MNQEPNNGLLLIEAAVKNLRKILNEQLVLLEESLRSSSGDVHAMVAERKSLASKLKLDQKLTEIWEEVKYYPGWAKREEWLKDRLCEIDDPKAEKRDKEQDISFPKVSKGVKSCNATLRGARRPHKFRLMIAGACF